MLILNEISNMYIQKFCLHFNKLPTYKTEILFQLTALKIMSLIFIYRIFKSFMAVLT
jgi:hypothetical protein